MIVRAIDMAKLVPEDLYCGLADETYLTKTIRDLDCFDTANISMEKLVEDAKMMEEFWLCR